MPGVFSPGIWWRDALREYSPHKTLYMCWSAMGVFIRLMDGLVAGKAEPQTIMIDAPLSRHIIWLRIVG